MNKNRILAFLLVLISALSIMCTSINIYAEDYDDESYDDSSSHFSPGTEVNPSPVLKMSSDGIFTFSKGESRDVEVSIKNVSSFYAYNILIQPVASGNNFPYQVEVLDKSNTKYYLQNTTTMKLKLRITIDDNAKGGIYPLTLNYVFNANNKSGFTGSDTLYIKVNGDVTDASVSLKNFKRSAQRVAPSGNVTISADLVNEGKSDVENITVALTGLAADGIGMEDGSSTYNISKLEKGKSEHITFDLVAGKNIKSGSYPLAYKLTYSDKDGKEITKEFGYYINVEDGNERTDTQADLTVTASEPSGTYSVGQSFSVKLTVKNNGEHKADNIVITAGGDKDNAVVPRSTSVKQIKSLDPGKEQSFIFDFAATSEAGTKNYPLSFEIEYETGKKTEEGYETRKFTQYSGVNIYNPDKKSENNNADGEKTKTSMPKIIISRYECNPVIVEAGKTFDIEMTFKNTHAVKTVKNVKPYLTVDQETEKKGNVFTPNQCSNTYYIDEITPKGEVSHTFSMFTVPDADARTYTLNVNFEYEDAEFNEYKSTELVGINVKQKAELTTNDIIVPTDGYAGEPFSIAFDLYNTGKVSLSNVMVRVVGDGLDTTGATYYAGNLEAGASDTYDGSVIPVDMGTSSGKVIISYEDSSGEQYEKVQEFSINIDEAMPDEEYTEDISEEMPQEKSKLPLFIGIGAAAVIIIVIVAVVLHSLKKRRERELSE